MDDFREAYYWLWQNTAEDARVMSWWDYGYQVPWILQSLHHRYHRRHLFRMEKCSLARHHLRLL